MPREKLEPSQWVVDLTCLIKASGTALQEGGSTITTMTGLALLGSVLIVCVKYRYDLQASLQVLLSGAVGGAIVSDPKKSAQTIQQQFQKPVENVATATQASNVTEAPSGHHLADDDDEEWVTPQELLKR